MQGNPLNLGRLVGNNEKLILPASARERHLYVCGGTGVGKSKLLESCVRQDILNWKQGQCGLVMLDPHGLIYQNTMAWLAKHGLERPIVPIDLTKSDWVISYNWLRKRNETDPSVIVTNFVRALAHVWGEGGTDQTPLFARWATVILGTLYHNGYTIADVMHLLSREDIRRAMSANFNDPSARQAWQLAEKYPKEFEMQIRSTLNRFQRLLGPKLMRATFGQSDVSLDLLTAIEEGQIILVNLSTEGGKIEDEDADTFATLLLTDLWTAAKARGKQEREKLKPFYVYIDECQKFITPTIAENLDQSRGFGLHLTLANQFPSQFLNAGASGKAMYDSILANAGNKLVFRTEHPSDIQPLAQSLFMNTLDPDEVKLLLKSTKVVGYKEELRESRTTGTATSSGYSTATGGGSFHGESGSEGSGAAGAAASWNQSITQSSGESENWSESESFSESRSESVTQSSVMVPIMGEETSSVQYRSIDEQLFRAMQKLFDQEDRQFAIRFHGGPKAPLFVRTPTVSPASVPATFLARYRESLLKKLPFAIQMVEASKRLDGREHKLLAELIDVSELHEPVTAKRRIE